MPKIKENDKRINKIYNVMRLFYSQIDNLPKTNAVWKKLPEAKIEIG